MRRGNAAFSASVLFIAWVSAANDYVDFRSLVRGPADAVVVFEKGVEEWSLGLHFLFVVEGEVKTPSYESQVLTLVARIYVAFNVVAQM